MTKHVPARRVDNGAANATLGERLTRAVLDLAGTVPSTGEHASRSPDDRARALAAAAATKAALAAGTLLFGMTVRWQPFNGRLHLPLFVLLAPCVALAWERVRGPWLLAAVAVMAASALPSLLLNTSRPLIAWRTVAPGSVLRVPRDEQYFANRPSLFPPYSTLIRQIHTSSCTRVGLFADYDSWEYPLWSLGRSSGLTFVHEGAARGAVLSQGSGPCLWIGLAPPPEWKPPDHLRLIWRNGPLSLWR